jgi:DNA mismatch repair protein MSH2
LIVASVHLPLRLDTEDSQDYFSVHGQDALLIANTVYKTTNVIKYLGKPTSSSSSAQAKGLPSVTMSMAVAKSFLREALTAKQMRVEIWEGEGGKKTGNRWVLAKQVWSTGV